MLYLTLYKTKGRIRRSLISAGQIQKKLAIIKIINKMVQPRLYLWGKILVKQAMITIKRKIIEKRTKTYKNFYYIQREENKIEIKNIQIAYKTQENLKRYFC